MEGRFPKRVIQEYYVRFLKPQGTKKEDYIKRLATKGTPEMIEKMADRLRGNAPKEEWDRKYGMTEWRARMGTTDPEQSDMARDVEEGSSEPPNRLVNIAKGIGERGLSLAGGAGKVAGTLMKKAETSPLPLPHDRHRFGYPQALLPDQQARAAAREESPRESPFGNVPLAQQEELASDMRVPEREDVPEPSVDSPIGDFIFDIGAAVGDTKLGYKQSMSKEEFFADPFSADGLHLMAEKLAVSIPDYLAIFYNMPLYIAAKTGEIASDRVKNNEQALEEMTVQDVATALPFAALSAFLNKMSALRVISPVQIPKIIKQREITRKLVERLGEMLPKGNMFKRLAGKIALESATEGAQEGIEFAGAHAGTKKGVDYGEMGSTMAFGAAIGMAGGAVFGSAAEVERGRQSILLNRDIKKVEKSLKQRDMEVRVVKAEAKHGKREIVSLKPDDQTHVGQIIKVVHNEVTGERVEDLLITNIEGDLATVEDQAGNTSTLRLSPNGESAGWTAYSQTEQEAEATKPFEERQDYADLKFKHQRVVQNPTRENLSEYKSTLKKLQNKEEYKPWFASLREDIANDLDQLQARVDKAETAKKEAEAAKKKAEAEQPKVGEMVSTVVLDESKSNNIPDLRKRLMDALGLEQGSKMLEGIEKYRTSDPMEYQSRLELFVNSAEATAKTRAEQEEKQASVETEEPKPAKPAKPAKTSGKKATKTGGKKPAKPAKTETEGYRQLDPNQDEAPAAETKPSKPAKSDKPAPSKGSHQFHRDAAIAARKKLESALGVEEGRRVAAEIRSNLGWKTNPSTEMLKAYTKLLNKAAKGKPIKPQTAPTNPRDQQRQAAEAERDFERAKGRAAAARLELSEVVGKEEGSKISAKIERDLNFDPKNLTTESLRAYGNALLKAIRERGGESPVEAVERDTPSRPPRVERADDLTFEQHARDANALEISLRSVLGKDAADAIIEEVARDSGLRSGRRTKKRLAAYRQRLSDAIWEAEQGAAPQQEVAETEGAYETPAADEEFRQLDEDQEEAVATAPTPAAAPAPAPEPAPARPAQSGYRQLDEDQDEATTAAPETAPKLQGYQEVRQGVAKAERRLAQVAGETKAKAIKRALRKELGMGKGKPSEAKLREYGKRIQEMAKAASRKTPAQQPREAPAPAPARPAQSGYRQLDEDQDEAAAPAPAPTQTPSEPQEAPSQPAQTEGTGTKENPHRARPRKLGQTRGGGWGALIEGNQEVKPGQHVLVTQESGFTTRAKVKSIQYSNNKGTVVSLSDQEVITGWDHSSEAAPKFYINGELMAYLTPHSEGVSGGFEVSIPSRNINVQKGTLRLAKAYVKSQFSDELSGLAPSGRRPSKPSTTPTSTAAPEVEVVENKPVRSDEGVWSSKPRKVGTKDGKPEWGAVVQSLGVKVGDAIEVTTRSGRAMTGKVTEIVSENERNKTTVVKTDAKPQRAERGGPPVAESGYRQLDEDQDEAMAEAYETGSFEGLPEPDEEPEEEEEFRQLDPDQDEAPTAAPEPPVENLTDEELYLQERRERLGDDAPPLTYEQVLKETEAWKKKKNQGTQAEPAPAPEKPLKTGPFSISKGTGVDATLSYTSRLAKAASDAEEAFIKAHGGTEKEANKELNKIAKRVGITWQERKKISRQANSSDPVLNEEKVAKYIALLDKAIPDLVKKKPEQSVVPEEAREEDKGVQEDFEESVEDDTDVAAADQTLTSQDKKSAKQIEKDRKATEDRRALEARKADPEQAMVEALQYGDEYGYRVEDVSEGLEVSHVDIYDLTSDKLVRERVSVRAAVAVMRRHRAANPITKSMRPAPSSDVRELRSIGILTHGNMDPQTYERLKELELLIVPSSTGVVVDADMPSRRWGYYNTIYNYMRLKAIGVDTIHLLGHETIHAVRNLGMIRPKEWEALVKYVLSKDLLTHYDIPSRYPQYFVPAAGIIEVPLPDGSGDILLFDEENQRVGELGVDYFAYGPDKYVSIHGVEEAIAEAFGEYLKNLQSDLHWAADTKTKFRKLKRLLAKRGIKLVGWRGKGSDPSFFQVQDMSTGRIEGRTENVASGAGTKTLEDVVEDLLLDLNEGRAEGEEPIYIPEDEAAKAKHTDTYDDFAANIFDRIIQFFKAVSDLFMRTGEFTAAYRANRFFRKLASGEVKKRPEDWSSQNERPIGPNAVKASAKAPEPEPDPDPEPDMEGGKQRLAEMQEVMKTQEMQLPGLLDSFQEGLTRLKNQSIRHWEHIPEGNNVLGQHYAELRERLLDLERGMSIGVEKVAAYFHRINALIKTDDHLHLLTSKAALNDFLYTIQQGKAVPGFETEEQIMGALIQVEDEIAKHPNVQEAFDVYSRMHEEMRARALATGVLTPAQAKNKQYFRHQIMEYRESFFAAVRAKGKVRNPYQYQRLGSEKEINLNLFEVEAEWMVKMERDIAVKQFIDYLRESKYNKASILLDLVNQQNEILIDAPMSAKKRKALNGYRQRIEQDYANLVTALHDAPPEAWDHLPSILKKHQWGELDFSKELGPYQEELLRFLQRNEQMPEIVQESARRILMHLKLRRKWLKRNVAGYIPPDSLDAALKKFGSMFKDHELWQPDAKHGNERAVHIYNSKGVPQRMIEKMHDAVEAHLKSEADNPRSVEVLDLPVGGKEKHDLIQEVLNSLFDVQVLGGPKEQFLIPMNVALTLNNFRDKEIEGPIAEMFHDLTRAWKVYTLFAPQAVVRYNINNTFGDIDALLGNPAATGTFLHLASALQDLRAYQKGVMTQDMLEAIELGVTQTGLTMIELSRDEVGALESLDEILSNRSKGRNWIAKRVAGFFRTSKHLSRLRENLFRLAAYKHFKRQIIELGKTPADLGFGMSKRYRIMGLTNDRDRMVARLAKDSLGDYQDLTHNGRWIRARVAPFHSWTETNWKRYFEGLRNAMGVLTQRLKHPNPNATKQQQRAYWLKFGVYNILSKFMLMGAAFLFNQLFFRDEEAAMTPQQRQRLHINVGVTDDGELMSLKTVGAFADAMSWTGLDMLLFINLPDLAKGRTDMEDVMDDWAKAFPNKAIASINPYVKLAAELYTGRKYWPDASDPRPIDDGMNHFMSTFQLEALWAAMNRAAGGLNPQREWKKTIVNSFFQFRDVGELAYNSTRNLGYKLKDETWDGTPKPETLLLRMYAKSLRWGMYDQAYLAYKSYFMLLDPKDQRTTATVRRKVTSSMKRRAPDGMFDNSRDKRAFYEQMSEQEFFAAEKANKYWEEIMDSHKEKLPEFTAKLREDEDYLELKEAA